jgi:hypothetical protein
MKLSQEARDPWGLVIGALAGGLGWAVGLAPPLAAAVGGAVYAVKVGSGWLVNREPATYALPIRRSSVEYDLVRRADSAVRSFAQLTSSIRPGPVADRARAMLGQAQRTLDDVRRLAGQASSIAGALGEVDAGRLVSERDRLSTAASQVEDPEVRAELARSLESIGAQLDVWSRLQQAGAKLMARIEAVVIGLEGLRARLAEILTMVEAQSPTEGAERVGGLAEELDALRAGLEETEDLSRRALRAYQGEGAPADGPAPGAAELGPARPPRGRQSRQKGGSDAEAS